MLRRLGLALLTVLVLPACSGEAEPPGATLPPLTATPTPTAALPTPPPEAEPVTPEGAAAFARFYLDQVSLAYNRADPEPLRALSDSGCEGCNNLIAAVERLRDARETVEGGAYEVTLAVAPAPEEEGDFLVNIVYERPPSTVLDATGDIVGQDPAVPSTDALMRVVRVDDSWQIRGFRLAEGS